MGAETGFAPLHFSRQQHVHPIAASNTTAEQQAALTWRTPPTATYIKRTLLIMVLYLCCQCCCWHCHWSYSISTCPPTHQRLPVDSQSTLPHRGRQYEHILHSDKNAPQNIFLVFFCFYHCGLKVLFPDLLHLGSSIALCYHICQLHPWGFLEERA